MKMLLPDPIISEIRRLPEEFQPCYLYDTTRIRLKCRTFMQIPWALKSVHYATMAGIHPALLNIIREEGLHVFVNSLMHLENVSEAGFRDQEIVFTASAMTGEMMQGAGRHHVRINLDSPHQLAQWAALFPDKSAGIRCNIGDETHALKTRAGFFIGKESRLGFNHAEIEAMKGNRQINTLHLYPGTDILDPEYLMDCYRVLARYVPLFPRLSALNFGGGFGISENDGQVFPLEEYGLKVTRLMEQISEEAGRPLEMLLEPGRIITGESGYFVTRVTDVKIRPDVCFIGVNASTAQFPRPLFYGDSAVHPVVVLRNGEIHSGRHTMNSTIYGCSTYSRDLFLLNRALPDTRPGDLIVFGNAGAYCAAACTRFLGFPQPEELFL
jgi:diaminopimelate decarboxylase